MEEKINGEIRQYREAVFWGMPLRPLICSIIAILISILIYLNLVDILGQQLVSWLCMLASAPFILLGFCTWHGMHAEQIILVCLKDLLTPINLPFRSTNYDVIYFKPVLDRLTREEYNNGTEHPKANTGKS